MPEGEDIATAVPGDDAANGPLQAFKILGLSALGSPEHQVDARCMSGPLCRHNKTSEVGARNK
jgi:hypothetical protein